MDHYSREYAHTFRGRNKEIEELLANTSSSPITLLVGESGAGKTSLICAGLFPQSEIMSWKCMWTRPFGNPLENIKKTIWNAFFEGNPEGTLLDVMKRAARKCKPHTLLIAMDQFEDILNCDVQEILDDFIQVLMAVQTGTIIPNLRMLISFREDVFVKINSRLLKQITGSARSFPIVELEQLSREGAREALLAGLENGGIGIDVYQETGEKPLLEIILDDIQKGSDRLYPPYVQIVAETLCKRVDKNRPIITKELYSELGGADKIIADYLMELLKGIDSQKSEAERVLIFLTSSTGKRVQKSLSELSQETEIEVHELKRIVEKMVDLRMVRVVDDKLEIIHDYLGKIIEEELVMEEDRIVKLLEEQLNVFYQNYMMCGTPIRSPPFLARLYRYRRRIMIDEEKYTFILCTVFEEDGGLGWYWLRNADAKRLLEMICDLVSHGMSIVREKAVIALVNIVEPKDEGRIIKMLESGDRNVRLAAVRALGKIVHSRNRMKIFEMLNDEDWKVKEAAAQVIEEIAQPGDRAKIIEMLGHEYWYAREVAVKALGKIAQPEDWNLIVRMLDDIEESVRWTAAGVMKEIAQPENRDGIVEILNDEWSDATEAAREAFVKIAQPEDWDEIVQMLNDKDCRFRGAVASALEKIAQPKDRAKIIEMLSHEDDFVRRAARDAFLKVAQPEDRNDIIKMLSHEDWHFRYLAAEAFERMAQPKDRAQIIEMFSHEDDSVRRVAIRAFPKVAQPEDWDDIIKMLSHEDWYVRDSAARVMKELAQPEDWDEIAEMLDHEDSQVREFVTRLFLGVAQPRDREKIIEMLDHEDSQVRESAIGAFLRVTPPKDRDFLLDHLADHAQGYGEKQVSIFLNLSKLDENFYCPLHLEYPFTLLFRE
jgi:HEAT repeat protein